MSGQRRKRLICRLLNSHKWVRMRTSEEAYKCLRCGQRHFGPRAARDLGAFGSGGASGGGDIGGGGNGG